MDSEGRKTVWQLLAKEETPESKGQTYPHISVSSTKEPKGKTSDAFSRKLKKSGEHKQNLAGGDAGAKKQGPKGGNTGKSQGKDTVEADAKPGVPKSSGKKETRTKPEGKATTKTKTKPKTSDKDERDSGDEGDEEEPSKPEEPSEDDKPIKPKKPLKKPTKLPEIKFRPEPGKGTTEMKTKISDNDDQDSSDEGDEEEPSEPGEPEKPSEDDKPINPKNPLKKPTKLPGIKFRPEPSPDDAPEPGENDPKPISMDDLTPEEFVQIFKKRNLLKGVFMQYPQDKDPRSSYEIAIDLSSDVSSEELPYKVNPSEITHLHTTTVLDVDQSQFTQNGWENNGFKLGTPWISVAREVERQNLSETTKMKETVYTTSSKEYQRGWILFNKSEIKLSKKLLKEIDAALALSSEEEIKARLAGLFNDKWGHVLRLEVLLGGAVFNHMEMVKSSTEDVKVLEVKSRNSLELKVQQIALKGSMEVGSGTSTQEQHGNQTIASSWNFKGGNTLIAGENSKFWAPSIGDYRNWDVIRVRNTILLTDLLDDDRRTRVNKYAPSLAVQRPEEPKPEPEPVKPFKPAFRSYDPTGNAYHTDACGGGLRHSYNRLKEHLESDYGPGTFVFIFAGGEARQLDISEETPPDGYTSRVSGRIEVPTGKGYLLQNSQRTDWYVFKKAKFGYHGPVVPNRYTMTTGTGVKVSERKGGYGLNVEFGG